MTTRNTSIATGAFMLALGALFAFSTASTLGYAPADRSDLQITNIQSNRTVTAEYVDVTVQIQNIGQSASRNSWVGIYMNDTFRRSCAVPALNAGQSSAVKCRYYFAPGEKRAAFLPATFFVDDMEEIWELNENNNKERFSIPTQSNTAPVFVSRYVAPDPVVTAVVSTQSVCTNCFQNQAPTHIQDSYTRFGSENLYHYNPSARIYTVKTNPGRVACPYGTNRSCIQTTTYGQNDATGECKSFPTTCLPTTGWTRVARCESQTVGISGNNSSQSPFIIRNDEHFSIYNGELSLGQLIEVNVGDSVQAEVALMEIDNTKRNFVYQNISNNFSLETIDFPEDAVRCWTNRRSSGTTVYCRGQQSNTSIQYELRARSAGAAPIFSRVQYDLNGAKIERQGTQNFQIN